MKKLLITVLLALVITIVGRPIIEGERKGEDFFIVNFGPEMKDNTHIWMKDGKVIGFNFMDKVKEKSFKLQPNQTNWEL